MRRARWGHTLLLVSPLVRRLGRERRLTHSPLFIARENIIQICDTIIASENLESRDDLRVAVRLPLMVLPAAGLQLLMEHPTQNASQIVAYRDHPPQDRSYITRIYPFASDISSVQGHLAGLQGGSSPHALWLTAAKNPPDLQRMEAATALRRSQPACTRRCTTSGGAPTRPRSAS